MQILGLHIFSLFALVIAFFLLFQKDLFRILTGFFFLLVHIGILFLYLGMEFFFAVQIIIYTGGILILLLWIYTTYRPVSLSRNVLVGTGVFTGVLGFNLFFLFKLFPDVTSGITGNSFELATLGKLLSQKYAYWFEGISFLLFSALTGSVLILKKAQENERKNS